MKKLLLVLFLFSSYVYSLEPHKVYATGKDGLWDRFDFYTVSSHSGEIITKHKNGRINMRLPFKRGIRDGLAEIFYDNGQKESERFYKDGLITKSIKTWHRNGQLMSIMPIVDHQMHGTFKKWDDKGNLITVMEFVNDKRQGESREWFSSGKIKVINTFLDDELKYSKQYDESGKLFFESDFANVKK